MITLREQMKFATDTVRLIFQRQEHVGPMIHAIDANGQHHMAMIIVENKDVAAQAIREFIREKSIQQIIYMAEAWVLTKKKDEIPPSGSIADHPDRQEALIFQGENISGETLCAQIMIKRNGEKSELGNTDVWVPTIQAGRLTDLFKKIVVQ